MTYDPGGPQMGDRRRRPPYADLLNERRQFSTNTWWILVGTDAWSMAKQRWERASNNHRPFTICPHGADPRSFDWSVYREAPVPIGLVRCGDVDGQQLQSLARTVLQAGAVRVYDIFADATYVRMAA